MPDGGPEVPEYGEHLTELRIAGYRAQGYELERAFAARIGRSRLKSLTVDCCGVSRVSHMLDVVVHHPTLRHFGLII